MKKLFNLKYNVGTWPWRDTILNLRPHFQYIDLHVVDTGQVILTVSVSQLIINRNRTTLFRSSYSSQIHLALNNLLDYSFKLYTLNMNTIYLLTIFDVSCNVGCHIYSEFPVCNNEPDAKRFSPPPFSFTRRDARMKMKRGGGSNWHSTRFRLLITYTQ